MKHRLVIPTQLLILILTRIVTPVTFFGNMEVEA